MSRIFLIIMLLIAAPALGVGAYEGVPLQIRAKAGTTIIIASTGTFTSVTYNLEERLIQL